MLNKYFHDYEIGETWVSKGRTITETDLVMFSGFSGDWFPLHTNKEYAENTQFKQRIAHGMLILSVATGLFQFEPEIVVAFYGLEKVRFINPTYIGDTIHIELKVIELLDKGHNGVVSILEEIKKQDGSTVAVANMKILVNSIKEVQISQ